VKIDVNFSEAEVNAIFNRIPSYSTDPLMRSVKFKLRKFLKAEKRKREIESQNRKISDYKNQCDICGGSKILRWNDGDKLFGEPCEACQ